MSAANPASWQSRVAERLRRIRQSPGPDRRSPACPIASDSTSPSGAPLEPRRHDALDLEAAVVQRDDRPRVEGARSRPGTEETHLGQAVIGRRGVAHALPRACSGASSPCTRRPRGRGSPDRWLLAIQSASRRSRRSVRFLNLCERRHEPLEVSGDGRKSVSRPSNDPWIASLSHTSSDQRVSRRRPSRWPRSRSRHIGGADPRGARGVLAHSPRAPRSQQEDGPVSQSPVGAVPQQPAWCSSLA